MRILILNTSDNTGGAAIAARRLMRALCECGHDARMLVRDKTTDDARVTAVQGRRWSKAVDRARIFAANGFTRDKLWLTDAGFCGCGVADHPLIQWAEVIHLHWVNQGYMSLDDIGHLLRMGKRVVWTMHDMWPVTGICHYAVDCIKYHTAPDAYGGGCHHCEQLCRPSAHDLSYTVFARKARLYADARIAFVACSRWLAGQARLSALTQGHTVIDIPNTIDTALFAPDGHRHERMRILFSSANVGDERKGMAYLIEACSLLADLSDRVEIVVLGQRSDDVENRFALPVRCVPYLSDPRQIAALNASVDLFVTPSLQDNLPNTIMEAMACGTPCVGFRVGGIPEMIDHGVNGYVATMRDARDLARGIREALAHREEWGREARRKVLETYSASVVVERYLEVYGSLT